MKLFEKIKKRRAKRYLIKSLKIISKLSWEELDDILPRPNYKDFFAFNVEDWSNLKLTYPFNPTEKGDLTAAKAIKNLHVTLKKEAMRNE